MPDSVNAEGLKKLMVGKTIKQVNLSTYLGWITIDSIVTDDGYEFLPGGNADMAYVDEIFSPDGNIFVEHQKYG